jgi:hypothetical protein
MHLEEAIDLIDYNRFDDSHYLKGPLWAAESHECHCHEEGHECHCHEDGHECGCGAGHDHDKVVETFVESPQFNVSKLNLTDPLHIYTEKFSSFIIYICIEGAASIQVPSENEKGEACMENYEFGKGETILIPADMPDFFLVPRDRSTVILEAVTRPVEELDAYIDPETEAFLEDEDYEGLEDGAFDEEDEDVPHGPSGASPLGFFGAGRGPLS